MALERSDVEKIAHLACLGLNEADLPHITSALNSILGLVDEMQAVNTDGIEPLAHTAKPAMRAARRRRDRVQSPRGLPVHRTSGRKRPVPGSESHRPKGKSLSCIT